MDALKSALALAALALVATALLPSAAAVPCPPGPHEPYTDPVGCILEGVRLPPCAIWVYYDYEEYAIGTVKYSIEYPQCALGGS